MSHGNFVEEQGKSGGTSMGENNLSFRGFYCNPTVTTGSQQGMLPPRATPAHPNDTDMGCLWSAAFVCLLEWGGMVKHEQRINGLWRNKQKGAWRHSCLTSVENSAWPAKMSWLPRSKFCISTNVPGALVGLFNLDLDQHLPTESEAKGRSRCATNNPEPFLT